MSSYGNQKYPFLIAILFYLIFQFGGRLEWTLPGKTKLIAHLKDESKIRKKKRWSQVFHTLHSSEQID